MSRSTLSFFGGTNAVTGANFLLESDDGYRILVDCGLVQGSEFASQINSASFPYDPATIDLLLVTHAHIDHIGRIPKLVRDGFKGRIISTPETARLAPLMLQDALRLMEGESRRNGILPFYEAEDVEATFSLWETVGYHTTLQLDHGFSMYCKDAGHILGSAMIELSRHGKSIVFTGDLGNTPSPLLRDTERIDDADYLVMESVYGDRNHEGVTMRREKLLGAIKDAILRKGTLLIPSFSLEKAQVLLLEINGFVEGGQIPVVPVYVDSPLAIEITNIYREMKHDFNDAVQEAIRSGDEIFSFPKLRAAKTGFESRTIASVPNPKIIIAGSGMSTGGRILSHEKLYLPEERNTILFVGYQSAGSLGREIQDGAKEVEIEGEKVAIRAHVETISGYSSHKDSDNLLAFVEPLQGRVRKVFVVMGELKSSLFLVQRLRDYFGIDAIHPDEGSTYELEL